MRESGSFWSSIEETFVALSLAATIATQFRFAGAGFGVSELLIATWAFCAIVARIGNHYTHFCIRGLTFVGLFFLAYLKNRKNQLQE